MYTLLLKFRHHCFTSEIPSYLSWGITDVTTQGDAIMNALSVRKLNAYVNSKNQDFSLIGLGMRLPSAMTFHFKVAIAYRIAGNFREHKFSWVTKKHAREIKFRNFYFHDKVTISDHTPYNFSHVNGELQHVFQQNDGKMLACLSKSVGRCWQRTAMPKGGSWLRGSIRGCGDDRRVMISYCR